MFLYLLSFQIKNINITKDQLPWWGYSFKEYMKQIKKL